MEQSHLSFDNYDVCFDEINQYVTLRFKTHIQGKEYREALVQGIDCLVVKSYSKWLAGSTSHIVINSDDRQWLLNEWIQASQIAGLKYFAAVMPLSNTGQKIIENMGLSISNEPLTYRLFKDKPSAVQWLSEQPNS
jgi:hypothetical protein